MWSVIMGHYTKCVQTYEVKYYMSQIGDVDVCGSSPGSQTRGSGRNCGKLHTPSQGFDLKKKKSTIQTSVWSRTILMAYKS